MSTGENINANGSQLTETMVRLGFMKFPQTVRALVSPAIWPQIARLWSAQDYPFRAEEGQLVPRGEMWFLGSTGEILGRIVNIG